MEFSLLQGVVSFHRPVARQWIASCRFVLACLAIAVILFTRLLNPLTCPCSLGCLDVMLLC